VAVFNRLAGISEALFQGGGSQPQMRFTLKLQAGENIQSVTMALHGETLMASAGQAAVEKTFLWPGSAPRARVDARAGSTISFSFEGLWAVFQMMGDAEPRAPLARFIELRRIRGGRRAVAEEVPGPDGRPIVVKLEVVELPVGGDAFHPTFFTNLVCPSRATQ
jgi:type VI protein secretion system component VasK